MLSDSDRAFLKANHQAVLTTFRKDGGAQMSIVTCGVYRDGVAFTTEAQRAKLLNLQRNPRCSLLVSKRDWWGYLVLEGQAVLLSPGVTSPAELRQGLRDVCTAASGKTHQNWQEYDAAMIEERRSVVMVVPERVYGMRR